MGLSMQDQMKRPAPKPETKPVKLLKNYFQIGGGKLLKGSEVELPADEARAAVSKGIAVRNDVF